MASFMIEQIAPRNNKNALLEKICCKDWLHNPPAEFISDYLQQTQYFQIVNALQDCNHFIINFYAPGADKDAPVGTHSCRGIIGLPDEESWQAAVEQARTDALNNYDLDVVVR